MKSLVVVALVACIPACMPREESETLCNEEAGECPSFSKDATKVACDCQCELAISLTDTMSFAGKFEACLPPDVNRVTASPEERIAIDTMTDATYSRRVSGVCSSRVPEFLEAVARAQLGARYASVCLPRAFRCQCAPRMAWRDGNRCDRPCPDVPCNADTCTPVLRENNILYTDACVCSRIAACGRTVPGHREAALCRVAP